ncbi:hypothetical protein [uncultured Paracoccus sp.]|uniref:hypothetical protein n=1 Tax=uncultured Paracoccus sp. TaxID=189685 RepID=UPI0025D8F461|nr:hypothetical protein [uncultured Paracoccus sp.]
MRRLFALLMMIALAVPAWADDRPRAGLMWNRSGLPATLPLVVKTMPGRDYVVFLAPPEGGDPVMAGYIRGGDFFRLLVPPGTWAVLFAHGREWQGDDALFGPLTDWTRMDRPMTFGAGVARKQGHIIRLIENGGKMQVVSAGRLDLCQGLMLTTETVKLDQERDDPNRLPTPGLRRLDTDLDVRTRVCG